MFNLYNSFKSCIHSYQKHDLINSSADIKITLCTTSIFILPLLYCETVCYTDFDVMLYTDTKSGREVWCFRSHGTDVA